MRNEQTTGKKNNNGVSEPGEQRSGGLEEKQRLLQVGGSHLSKAADRMRRRDLRIEWRSLIKLINVLSLLGLGKKPDSF